jgi:hypothetical protein
MAEVEEMERREDAPSLRERWTPPPRPEWVERINAEGRYIDGAGVVPFDENSLIRTAKSNTGLSDFGSDDWIEPFRVFIRALDEEANLSLMGRILTRSDLLMFLEARLTVEDWYKRHPEIEDEVVDAPFMVVGQGRSGTSFLLNLLEFDPDNTACQSWEAMFPTPPPEKATYATDPRIALADARITQWSRVNPSMYAVHELGGTIPTETIQLQAPSFQGADWLVLLGQVPSYNAYMETIGYGHALRYERRMLKLLQWRNPRKRWVLKSPGYLRYLPTVLETFPDVRLIWTHRDPVKALSSMVNTMGTLFWMRTDDIRMAGALDHLTDPHVSAAALSRPIEWLESGVVPKEQLFNLQYGDLVDNPVGTVEAIYSHFDMTLSDSARAAMDAYMLRHPRSARPSHAYTVADGNSIERRAYARYQNYFEVPSES